MDSSVRDKIEEEVKSMKNADKNPSPNSAGSSDNSSTTTVVVGSRGKRKEVNEDRTPPIEPSLKRICATPSSDESTLVQNAQGVAKIEEEVKSMKHAEKNASPNSAGSSDNSTITTVVDDSTRKRKEVDEEQTPRIEPSLKRICGTPSSDESTLVQTAPVDKELTPLIDPSPKRICGTPSDDSSEKSTLVQNAQVVDIYPDPDIYDYTDSDNYTDTDSDTDPDEERRRGTHLKSIDEIEEERRPTDEEFAKYMRQIEDSKGFDVSYYYRIHTFFNCMIHSVSSESIDYEIKMYKHFMDIAAAKACEYLDDQEELEDMRLLKATRVYLGRRSIHYITFIAKGSFDGVVRCYQAKVTRIYVYGPDDINLEDTVHFVWLKDECGQVSAEERKQREGCDADSLRQLYMEVFCPIEPVSRDSIKVSRRMFKKFMKLAVKACDDSGGQMLNDLEVEEAYKQIFGLITHYYISFKGSLDGECRFYHAKVIITYSETCSKDPNITAEFVSRKDPDVKLKDDHGQVFEERIKHRKQNEARKCFDVERTTDMKIPGVITPVDPETLKGEDYKHFMGLIIAAAMASKVCGEFEEDLDIEKANKQCFGCFTHHYITFSANGSSLDGKCKRYYQAKVTCHSDSDSECECYKKPEFKDRVEFVWLKE